MAGTSTVYSRNPHGSTNLRREGRTMDNQQRCPWCGDDPLYVYYHDTVWGRPEYDDLALFEKRAWTASRRA